MCRKEFTDSGIKHAPQRRAESEKGRRRLQMSGPPVQTAKNTEGSPSVLFGYAYFFLASHLRWETVRMTLM
ncbi:MAG: hypothetical protein IKD69_10225, partial [Solobacterium sp.]|nr:hypothetical protein [Solobacterium sp.]